MYQNQVDQSVNTRVIDDETRDMDSIPFNLHEQYLDELYRQYNIEVHHALLFYVAGEESPIIFVNKTEIDIGRADAKGRIVPEFDLSTFDGAKLGVSRLHAKIVYDDGQYMIEDLHSTNHTWVNGQKLVPYHYTPVSDGSIIQVGHLATNVFVIQR